MLKKETAKRIQKLIAFMETLPPKAGRHFYMGSFLEHTRSDHMHVVPKKPEDILSCGTSACALGWAATMPYFRKLGLRFNQQRVLKGTHVIFPRGSRRWLEMFAGYNGDRTPKQWAKRAKGLLKEWSA